MDITANLALLHIDEQVRAQFPNRIEADPEKVLALVEQLAGEAVKAGQLRRVA